MTRALVAPSQAASIGFVFDLARQDGDIRTKHTLDGKKKKKKKKEKFGWEFKILLTSM